MYYHLKRLRVKMLDILLDRGVFDKYFENKTVSMNGEIHSIKSLLNEYLISARKDFDSLNENPKKGKYMHQISNSKIVEVVSNYCEIGRAHV